MTTISKTECVACQLVKFFQGFTSKTKAQWQMKMLFELALL